MSNYIDMLNQYAFGTPPSQPTQAPEQQNQMPPDEYFYQAAAARRNGRAGDPKDPLQQDLIQLSGPELIAKYGPEQGMSLIQLRARGDSRYTGDRYAPSGESAWDVAKAVPVGLANAVGGVAVLGTGIVNDQAGADGAQLLNEFNSWAHSKQSDGLNRRRRASQADRQFAAADSQAQFEKDVKTDGSFVAHLKRVGRDVLDTGKAAWNDSSVMQDVVSEGLGSLLAGGPMSKGLRALGGAVNARLLGAGLITEAAAAKAAQVGGRLAMPTTIGSMEAGGAYQQTVSQVLDMSHGQLMAGSKEYADLIAQGWSQDDAKVEVATTAGLKAAGITAPVAALTGTLVSKFETNPFKVGRAGSIASNLLNETVEESIQSGAGQFAGNYGIKTTADSSISLSDGVGEQTALGALGGLGSAGAAQTPGAVVNGAVGTGKLAVKGTVAAGKAAVAPLVDRVNRINSERAAASPVSPQNLSAQADALVASTGEVQAQVEDNIARSGADTAQADLIRSRMETLTNTIAFDPTELDSQDMSPELKQHIGGATNRFDALHRAALVAGSTEMSPTDRIEAALYINDTLGSVGGQMTGDLVSALEPLPDNHEILPKLRQYEDVLINLQNNPEILKAVSAARQYVERVRASDISEANIATPKGQQAAHGIVSVAQTNPEDINPEIADIVLEHARKGRLKLSPVQTRMLSNAAAIVRIGNTYQTQAKKMGLSNQELVSKEILNNDTGADVVEKSAAGHLKGIMAAMQSGDTATAAARLRDMMMFAQHMQNKLVALNQSLESGNASKDNTTSYKALTPNRKWVKSLTGVWLDPKHTGSVKLAQQISIDAGSLAEMANHLATTMPELGVQPIELTELNPVLQGPANEIARKFRKGQLSVDNTPPITQATEPAKVDPQAQAQPSTEVKTESKAPEAAAPETKPTETESPESRAPEAKPEAPKEAVSKKVLVAEQAEITSPPAKVTTGSEDTVAPAPAAETEQVNEVPAASTLEEAYPQLIGSDEGKVKNWFRRAFKFPKVEKSRLFGVVSPFLILKEALKSDTAITDVLGNSAGRTLTGDLTKAYAQLMDKASSVAQEMDKRLLEFLQEKTGKDGPRFGDALVDGLPGDSQVNGWFRGKILNIVEHTEEGSLAYNQNLLEGAILAGIQWAITAGNMARSFDAEAAAKILGMDEASITENELDWLNSGVWLTEAKRSLGEQIIRYWGVVPDASAPEGYVKGIAESTAAEVIRGMEAAGLIKTEETKLNGKTFYRLVGVESEENSALFDNLQAFPDAIEKIVSIEPEDVHFIGEAPKNVPTHQMHGSPAKLSDQQRSAAEAAQNTPYKINPSMLSFLEMLGRDGLRLLFGKGDPTETRLNREHAKSIEGYNRTLDSAFRALSGLVAEMRNREAATGEKLDEQNVFFRYGFTSVGRLQMLGRANPQSSKLVREVLLPTWSTLDLTDRTGEHYRSFMLAMAQHLGIKVHKLPTDQSITAVEELLTGKLAGIVEMLHEWHGSLGDKVPLSLEEADITTIRETLGSDLSFGAIHALMEYARYLDAKASGDLGAFKTALYLEADGVTDGPINAMMNFVPGKFTTKWLDLMNRGGLFLGSAATSLNDYVSRGKEQSEDLYQKTTNLLQRALANLAERLTKNAAAQQMNQHMLELLTELLPDLHRGDDGGIDILRGIVKNPLTVTVYGSGTRGIANKVTAQAVKALYEKLSDGWVPTAAQQKALQMLTTHVVKREFGRYQVTNLSRETDTRTGSGVDFKLTPGMVENLQSNIMALFAVPMRAAISEMMGDALGTSDLVRMATQVQSIHLKYAFRQAVSDALANRSAADGTLARDFLSKQELDAILKGLLKSYPMIDTGTQLVFVGASSQADVETSDFGRDLNDKMKSPGYVYGPENAGVAGIPYLVISTGDGQMILNALTMESAPDGVLPVFDGINMPLDQIGPDSAKINEAVYKGWVENPVGALQESFSKFLSATRADTALDMSEELRKELGQALSFDDSLSPAEIAEQISKLHEELATVAEEVAARKAVLAKVNLSIDHMASASSPFVKTEGEDLPSDPAEMVTRLNEMLDAELARQGMKREKAQPSEDLTKILETMGVVDETGTRIISRDELRSVADQLDVPAMHKSLIRETANALTTAGWSIRFGTEEQLLAHIEANDLSVPQVSGPVHGIAMPKDKIIHLVSPNSETLAHELLHAATVDRVYSYYAAPHLTSAQVRETMGRIEKLMEEFLAIDPKTIKDADTRSEFEFALTAMANASQQDGISEALQKTASTNEFMVWVLSNQKLADLARNTQVKNPLARIAKAALDLLRKIWRMGLAPSVGQDIYSNLRFNTLALMHSKDVFLGSAEELAGLAQFHAAQYGSSDRLTSLELGFNTRMAEVIRQARARDPLSTPLILQDHMDMRLMATTVRRSYQVSWPGMTMQEASLFETMITAFAVDGELDGVSLARSQELFQHVLKNLSVEDFMVDPNSQDPNVRANAQRKFDLIVGNYAVGMDKVNRSSLLPSFLALATVNDEFRNILSRMPLPKGGKIKGETLDQTLTNIGTESMSRLTQMLSGEGVSTRNIRSAIDLMAARMAESADDRLGYIDQFVTPVGNAVDKGNGFIVDMIQDLTSKAGEKLNDLGSNSNSKAVKLAASAGEAIVGIFNNDVAEKQARGIISILNKADVWKPVQELFNEMVGRTKENATIYDMIKASRAFIQQVRQIYRERLPSTIASKFSRALSKQEWSVLHTGMIKTDLAALDYLGTARLMDILKDDSRLQAEITRIERNISALDTSHEALLKTKSKELAEHMMTGKVSGNLLRNAEAIAHLFGELPQRMRQRRGNPSNGLFKAVDRLTTLYALDMMSVADRTMLSRLASEESAGMSFVFDYLAGQRSDELAKMSTRSGQLNHYKGRAASEPRSGTSLVVADDRHYADLTTRGYVRTGTYEGSLSESGRPSMGYYHAPLAGRSRFNQGIAQNIRQTLYGVDPVTGFTIDMHNAGRITDQAKVAQITAARRANQGSPEPLMPVYDASGDVVAYERSLDPAHVAMLEHETDLSKVLGIWRGRQVEEASAMQLNHSLVGRLHDIWVNKEVGRDDEFVDLLDPQSHKDPVIADAVKLFTPEMLRTIKAYFGGDGFMVRKDMINDAVGYRSPSIGDAWTGVTRIDPRVSRTAADVATAVFGKEAYRYMVTAEKLWQNFVSDARTTIVVRSVIVPVSNMVSNVYQLASRGVPLLDIGRKMPKKLAEIHSYHENHIREMAIEAEIRASKRNPAKLKSLQAELKSIQDSHRRLSIWPLIAAGEFSSVSEATVIREDSTLFEGKVTQYVERLVDRLPDAVRNAGRYAIISRDTPLFQGLQRAVEYGDFLAKAILYDDLVKRQGKDSAYALARIGEEFVNYDRLPGRFRGGLESMGLLWFWHFKLRAIKIALSTMRNNPLHLVLSSLVPAPEILGSVGTPVTDNALAVMADGKIGYSIGPLQGVHAHALNPWFNLFN